MRRSANRISTLSHLRRRFNIPVQLKKKASQVELLDSELMARERHSTMHLSIRLGRSQFRFSGSPENTAPRLAL